ncbi:MAG: alpha,6-mannosyltransferase [Acidobacteriota bacterium]|nr:alpha,6-mannosyltransferase [Acidobacteriota bacterium]
MSDAQASNEQVDGESSRRALRSLFRLPNVALIVLGCASLLLYQRAQRLAPGTESISAFVRLALLQCVIYAAAAVVAWRARSSRTTLLVIIVFATLFRFDILCDPPRLSDDIYRYIWDGRVQAAGVNPYRYVPADNALAHLRDASIYEHINRRDYAQTIYPPVAQMILFAATRVSESVVWMKCVMVAFEACALWAVASLLASFKLPRQRIMLAAWHPLMVWEIAGSGHLDAIMICFVALALLAHRRRREGLTGLLLACAALTKLYPVALAPALYRRWNWRTPVAFVSIIVAAYLPYLSVGLRRAAGFLAGYAEEEGLQNGTRFYLLSLARRATGGSFEIPNAAFVIFAILTLAALALWSLQRSRGDAWPDEDAKNVDDARHAEVGGSDEVSSRRSDRGFVTRAFVMALAFTVLLSPRYSWYFIWLVPFLCIVPAWFVVPVVYMTAASFVLYLSWLGDDAARMFALHSIIYLPFAALCAAAWLARRLRRGATEFAQPTRGDID